MQNDPTSLLPLAALEEYLHANNGSLGPDRLENERPRYIIRNAAYALQPQPEIDWVIAKLITAGSVNVVVGPFGSKKTYSLIYAAVCISLGKNFLDLPVKQCKTLIIDEESGERRLTRRIGEALRGAKGDENTPIDYVSLAQFNLRGKNDQTLLTALIETTQAKFVVIDALADIMPGADENAVKDTQPVFMALRSIADKTGAAIVLIHHTNKIGDYRGSTAIGGAVDCMLMVESKDGTPTIYFETRKIRDGEPLKFSASACWEEKQFWLEPTHACEEKALSKSQRFVLEFIQSQPATLNQIVEYAGELYTKAALKAALNTLIDLKIVERVNPGGKGAEGIYAVVKEVEVVVAP